MNQSKSNGSSFTVETKIIPCLTGVVYQPNSNKTKKRVWHEKF